MSLGGRDDIYPAVSAYSSPTPASGGRNRYAEIMSQYGQAQPFSFFGYPQTYTGGYPTSESTYTGGFTPYERLVSQQSAAPVESTTSTTAGGGGVGGAVRESPSAWSQMTPAERAAYYAANPIEGKLALLAQDYYSSNPFGFISKLTNPDAWYNSKLEKQGLDPESFAYGPPDPNFSSQGAAAARNEAMQSAIAAANADTGFVANPMSVDPSQRITTPAPSTDAGGLLTTPPPAPAPVVTAPLVEAPVPVVTAPIVEAPAPIPAYVAPAPEPVQMVDVIERWNGPDAPDPGQGWTRFNMGRGEVGYERTVSVPVGGRGGASGGGSGGYTVGGYAPGSQAAAAAASGQFGMGPGTPGFNSGGAGFAKGGYVSMQHLGGPDPDGPDDGYAALKDGEFVINDKAVKKYGIELMNLINSGKISKGKLRGLLEI